jgi:hypothetical protein
MFDTGRKGRKEPRNLATCAGLNLLIRNIVSYFPSTQRGVRQGFRIAIAASLHQAVVETAGLATGTGVTQVLARLVLQPASHGVVRQGEGLCCCVSLYFQLQSY